MKEIILWAIFTMASLSASAQLPPACLPGQLPADNCSDACIYCNFNGIISSTTNYTAGPAPNFCGSIENDQWLGFIAGASSATFTVTPFSCTMGNGLQMALYDDCNGSPIDCNGGGMGNGSTPVSLVDVPLNPGSNYFLVIDGFGGDQCTFSITVDPPIAVIAPPLGNNIGPIQGPITVCPGATVTYSIPPVANAAAYTWTVPNGWLINGVASPQQLLTTDGGNSVQITFGATSGTICVQAANSCALNGPSVCKSVSVVPIPPTTLQPAFVCFEDAPYNLPWGDQAPSSGLYQTTMQSYLGCDSIVRQQVTIKTPLLTFLQPRTICAGDHVTICGVDYFTAGSYSHMCESYLGCDSVINFSFQVLDPVANINGGGALTCNTSSITLTASPSPTGTVLNWKNLAGQVLGITNSLTVTAAGTYILTATLSGGGAQCVKADTVVIPSNILPPSLSATGGTLNCAVDTVMLSANSNATPQIWSWAGPGGFTSSLSNPLATQLGTYTVTITNVGNGCSATTTVMVNGDTAPPAITTFGATLSCAVTSTQITTQSLPNTATFQWDGPNSFTADIQTPTVTEPGNYNVTVTNTANNCTTTGTAIVDLDNTPPGANASPVGAISCSTPAIMINGGPGMPGNTFSWMGPNSFTSMSQNPTASDSGTYTIVVRGANGCTSTASTFVTGDTLPPNAAASGGLINCITPSTLLSGTSTTTGATYGWIGPVGFMSNLQNPSVSDTGLYLLTVTGPNTCTNTASAIVQGNFELPDVSAVGGSITCSESTITISGSSNTQGATLRWTGPGGFISNLPSVVVNTVGNYILTATGPNGCKDTAIAMVLPDANLPNATADGGELTCADTSIMLNGGSSTQGALLEWTGPNNFTSTLEDPTISLEGTYILTVTNPGNGCTAEATAIVTLENTEPGATTQGGTLTCAQTDLNLSGGSTASNVTWSWSGPNFNATVQNPNVTVEGAYVLTVTSNTNGCTSSSSTLVLLDVTPPIAASTTGILTCSLDSLTLMGSSDVTATFQWSGPAGFLFTGQDPIVVAPGDYTLIATASGNGCTDTLLVVVDQDIALPDAAATSDTISCNTPQVPITSSSTAGITYQWSGPGNFSSDMQNETASLAGLYTVTVTGSNGCTNTAETTVVSNTEVPEIVSTANDVITCLAPSINIQTIITTVSNLIGVLWSGPNNYTSTVENALVFEGGIYTIVATAENGCTATLDVLVQEDTANPDADATGATLTCTDTIISLDGISQTLGVLFDWTGPNGFSSADEDPMAMESGTYTVVVTAQNGCTDTAEAMVDLDVTPPGAATTASNSLDCDDLSSTLTGSSQTQNVVYLWSGPNNFSAATATTIANEAGTYQITITAQNGCVSTSSVTVTQDISPPDAGGMGGTIDCISGQLNLTGISATNGATFVWTGPNNFNAPTQNPTVSTPGQYFLTVTGPNGCTATATATVIENTSSPVVNLGGPTTINCQIQNVTLTSAITTPGATGIWTGPNNFTASTPDISVSAPGLYVFTVTATNGCISAPSLTVLQNTAPPQGVSATGGLLNCLSPSIALASTATTTGVTYAWTGPGNYTSPEQNPAVTTPGTYTVVVTNPVNFCTTSATAVVTQDPTVPDIAVQADSLTCSTTLVTLETTTMTPGVTFQWSGPNNFNSTLEDPQTGIAGLYSLVATAQSGCTAVYNYMVTQNINLPNVNAFGDTLTCTQQSGQIGSTSTTSNVTFSWVGPGNFMSNQASPNVTVAGLYTVVVTSPNGCSASAQATVSPDVNAPVVTATGGTITCLAPSVLLGASANIGVNWQWTGPGNFMSTTQNPMVTVAGNYNLAATAPNGCVTSMVAVVLSNTTPPNISTETPNELDCTTTQVGLGAGVIGAGQYSYHWTSQNGVILSGMNTNTPQVIQAGLYTVQVTDLSNGCTNTSNVTVVIDPATPAGAAYQKKDITCYGETDGSLRIDSIQGGTPPFVYSIDNQAFRSTKNYPSLTPGTHSLVVQDANGCEFATTFFIEEPEDFYINLGPDTTLHLGQSIILNLDHYASDPDRIVDTRVTPTTLILPDTLEPVYSFRYFVEAIDSNGCRAKDDRTILVDRDRWVFIPNIFNPNSVENSLVMVFGGEDVALVKTFLVFDRWGNAIHEYKNFQPNNPASGWNGVYNGQPMSPGVYVYFAEVLFKDGETEIFKGDVTLIR